MDRTQRLLRTLTKKARLIEVGPSFNPLAPKREGWNTFVIDHASREELIVKYADQNIARIEEVDFVWRGGSLTGAVPEDRHGTFDAVIASHVIEHTTDVVMFLKAAETLIRPDGVVVLAVPDKRKCFDFYRHPSTTADALVAHAERRDRHDARTHFEYAMRMCTKGGGPGWRADDAREAVVSVPFEQAHGEFSRAAAPHYEDAHAWVFVPASFSLMIMELAALGRLDLRVEEIVEADATEFYAWLRRGREDLPSADLQARRKTLMDRIVVELAEQSSQIAGSTLNALRSEPHVRERLAEADSRVAAARERLAEADCRAEALRTVLTAVRASTGRRGLDRHKFRALIERAARAVPDAGPAAVQHHVLLTEARRVLGLDG